VQPRSRRIPALVELPLLVAAAVVVTLLIKGFLAQAFYIPSSSMEPQLREHDRVVVSRTAYRLHEPRRCDIVVFPSPAAPPEDHGLVEGLVDDVLTAVAVRDPGDRDLIKRVIALPGETIQAREGRVLIDGRLLEEPYLDAAVRTGDFGPVAVPDGHVYVLGDNRPNSHDSRFPDIGPIAVDDIIGRAIARVWPPSRTAFL
jgi:signal peptidase I